MGALHLLCRYRISYRTITTWDWIVWCNRFLSRISQVHQNYLWNYYSLMAVKRFCYVLLLIVCYGEHTYRSTIVFLVIPFYNGEWINTIWCCHISKTFGHCLCRKVHSTPQIVLVSEEIRGRDDRPARNILQIAYTVSIKTSRWILACPIQFCWIWHAEYGTPFWSLFEVLICDSLNLNT